MLLQEQLDQQRLPVIQRERGLAPLFQGPADSTGETAL